MNVLVLDFLFDIALAKRQCNNLIWNAREIIMHISDMGDPECMALDYCISECFVIGYSVVESLINEDTIFILLKP